MVWGRLLPLFRIFGWVVFGGPAVALCLPMLCCHRLRAVRWLPLAGLCYYVALGALVGVLAGWDFAALLLAMALLSGYWLLPNPVVFVLSPVRRRAAVRAVEYLEQGGGPRPMYWRVVPAGFNHGRPVVAVGVGGGYGPGAAPLELLFLAVGPDGAVEELFGCNPFRPPLGGVYAPDPAEAQ